MKFFAQFLSKFCHALMAKKLRKWDKIVITKQMALMV